MFKVVNGVSRKVFLIHNIAIKIPQISYQWRHFVNGLLCNILEVQTYRNHPDKDLMCKVLFATWGGWIVVMERADTERHRIEVEEGKIFNYSKFKNVGLGGDDKPDNYGYIKDKLVKIDYQ